jgi:hypothetical protein
MPLLFSLGLRPVPTLRDSVRSHLSRHFGVRLSDAAASRLGHEQPLTGADARGLGLSWPGLRRALPTQELPYAAFQADAQQLLRLHGELHRKFTEDLLAEAVHDHGDGIFGFQAALLQIEHLVFADF